MYIFENRVCILSKLRIVLIRRNMKNATVEVWNMYNILQMFFFVYLYIDIGFVYWKGGFLNLNLEWYCKLNQMLILLEWFEHVWVQTTLSMNAEKKKKRVYEDREAPGYINVVNRRFQIASEST